MVTASHSYPAAPLPAPPHHRDGDQNARMSDAVAGLLLTGGASARMGTAKADLVVTGERLADRGARLLRGVADPVLEVGPGYCRAPALPLATEFDRGEGPLTALVAGAQALAEHGAGIRPVLVLAVDMPR